MSTIAELTTKVLALPIKSRALIADVLLESLTEEDINNYETLWLNEANNRNREISSKKIECKTHEEAIKNARNKLSCK